MARPDTGLGIVPRSGFGGVERFGLLGLAVLEDEELALGNELIILAAKGNDLQARLT